MERRKELCVERGGHLRVRGRRVPMRGEGEGVERRKG
jgi:hypothetical protein